jgi:hypothetical protein
MRKNSKTKIYLLCFWECMEEGKARFNLKFEKFYSIVEVSVTLKIYGALLPPPSIFRHSPVALQKQDVVPLDNHMAHVDNHWLSLYIDYATTALSIT